MVAMKWSRLPTHLATVRQAAAPPRPAPSRQDGRRHSSLGAGHSAREDGRAPGGHGDKV